MLSFKVYTRNDPPCPYCDNAKRLIERMGQEYEEISISDPGVIDLFRKRGWKTVPQIFYNDHYIGGYTDLVQFFKREVPNVDSE